MLDTQQRKKWHLFVLFGILVAVAISLGGLIGVLINNGTDDDVTGRDGNQTTVPSMPQTSSISPTASSQYCFLNKAELSKKQ